MANLDLACYCLLLSICNLDSPTGCISFSQSLTTGPVHLKTIQYWDIRHNTLLDTQTRLKKKKQNAFIYWHFPPTACRYAWNDGHFRTYLRIKSKRPSPFTHTNIEQGALWCCVVYIINIVLHAGHTLHFETLVYQI